jgi:hypothetical protein
VRHLRHGRWALSALLFITLTTGVAGAAAQSGAPPAWSEYGAGPARSSDARTTTPASLRRTFVLPLSGRITSQVLFGNGLFYAATSAGKVVAFDRNGYVHWRADVGQLAHSCPQLDGYGVTGTGVLDLSAGTLYVADAFGRLHALALATGVERQGWPVRVFTDYRRQLAWGALSLVDGSVYVPTASYCDATMTGGLYRVEVADRAVTPWISVPASLGGGGGVWGWGGSAYSAEQHALFVVTGNAIQGGSNSGGAFDESAGFGERLVELGEDLSVQTSDHPVDIDEPLDLDFVGSPVVLDRDGCGELVVGADKNDTVYAWRADDVAAGPLWQMKLEPFDVADPLLSQLAWSQAFSSLYVATGTQLVRIGVAADCSPTVFWRKQLGTKTENGSPTIAGGLVWLVRGGVPSLLAYDAQTGARRSQTPLGAQAFVGPTIVDGRLVIGTMSGYVEGFGFGDERHVSSAAAVTAGPTAITVHQSWVDSRHGWWSRGTGLYATDDGGATWRRIESLPAIAVLRLSRLVGVIEVGSSPGVCMCSTRKLWTSDGGNSWRATTALGNRFAGVGGALYWWRGGLLERIAAFQPGAEKLPPSHVVTSFTDGSIVAVGSVPGGVAALVSNRVAGQHWDGSPRVVIERAGVTKTVRLPQRSGRILATQLQVTWPTLTVTGTAYGVDPVRSVQWTSIDGGETWSGVP